MGFIDEIKCFGERAKKLKNTLQTEEATKTSLIMPFFSMLGYDVFNPEEFVPEFTADVGIKKGEKCDEDMIREHKAAAYGEADGNLKENSYAKSGGEICEENYMHLDNFKVLKFPFTAAQMKLLSNSLAFQLTLYKIDNESGVAFIKKINADYL